MVLFRNMYIYIYIYYWICIGMNAINNNLAPSHFAISNATIDFTTHMHNTICRSNDASIN